MVDVTAIAAIATKNDVLLELGSRNRFALAAIAPTTPRAVHTLLVDAHAGADGMPHAGDAGGKAVAISGTLSDMRDATAAIPSAMPVVAILDVDELGNVEGSSLETAIELLDERADARPWHYVVRVRTIAAANEALASLFRVAPPLAHRVVGIVIAAGVPLSDELGRELVECAATFGVTFLGAATYDRPFYEAIAAT